MPATASSAPRPPRAVASPPIEPLDADAKALFETLRTLRRAIADENGVPAFIVFSDKTLREIARAHPTSRTAMLAVKGVGPAKYEGYGERFLEAIREHMSAET